MDSIPSTHWRRAHDAALVGDEEACRNHMLRAASLDPLQWNTLANHFISNDLRDEEFGLKDRLQRITVGMADLRNGLRNKLDAHGAANPPATPFFLVVDGDVVDHEEIDRLRRLIQRKWNAFPWDVATFPWNQFPWN
ncbi:uncharacterized protein DS421_7g221760 [Arachis hypogaea]|nr:uncharacterized protein DS421_7g221760 [Arachis hypogaea]